MGLFRIFSGKSPETHEQRGDQYVDAGAFGDARLEYDKALFKIEKHYPEKAHLVSRLNEKLLAASESLARSHMENADNLVSIGDFREARDLYALALELTRDETLKQTISEKIAIAPAEEKPARRVTEEIDSQDDDMTEEVDADTPDEADEADESSDDEIFSILCHALSPDAEDAYRGYGEAFMRGYIALNRGEFKSAAENLSIALEENTGKDSLIPLELATAFIHLKAYNRARDLVETYIGKHPREIRAYQLLCEICWETRDIARANRLFAEAPVELRTDPSFLLLQGETRFQEQAFDEAEAIFLNAMVTHGRDEIISRALAKTLEAKGEIDAARDLYAELINRCTSCRRAVDPFLKHRYAELCFKAGNFTPKLIEIYLGLTQEDPHNRALYYRRVAEIYAHRGETKEARRFEEIARKAG